MLLHQFILVTVGTVKRFEAVLLGVLRRAISREEVGSSEPQDTNTETGQAA